MSCPNRTTSRRSVNWPVIQESVLSCDFKASEMKTKLTLEGKEYFLHLNIKQDMHAMYWFAVNIDGVYHYFDIRKLPLSNAINISHGAERLERLRTQIELDFKESNKFEDEVIKMGLSK